MVTVVKDKKNKNYRPRARGNNDSKGNKIVDNWKNKYIHEMFKTDQKLGVTVIGKKGK